MVKPSSIRPHVAGEVTFQYYRAGNMYYKTETTNLVFPVPLDDIGNATLNSTDKGMLFMRYIRKHLEALNKASCEHKWEKHLEIDIGNNIWRRVCKECGAHEDL